MGQDQAAEPHLQHLVGLWIGACRGGGGAAAASMQSTDGRQRHSLVAAAGSGQQRAGRPRERGATHVTSAAAHVPAGWVAGGARAAQHQARGRESPSHAAGAAGGLVWLRATSFARPGAKTGE